MSKKKGLVGLLIGSGAIAAAATYIIGKKNKQHGIQMSNSCPDEVESFDEGDNSVKEKRLDSILKIAESCKGYPLFVNNYEILDSASIKYEEKITEFLRELKLIEDETVITSCK